MKPPPIRDQSESSQISQSRDFFSNLLGIVMQAAKNDVGFLQLIDSGLHSSYCALEKARSLLGRATQRTLEIVHVTPATIFHVRQTSTVDGQ
jgi:hypothetical protein